MSVLDWISLLFKGVTSVAEATRSDDAKSLLDSDLKTKYTRQKKEELHKPPSSDKASTDTAKFTKNFCGELQVSNQPISSFEFVLREENIGRFVMETLDSNAYWSTVGSNIFEHINGTHSPALDLTEAAYVSFETFENGRVVITIDRAQNKIENTAGAELSDDHFDFG